MADRPKRPRSDKFDENFKSSNDDLSKTRRVRKQQRQSSENCMPPVAEHFDSCQDASVIRAVSATQNFEAKDPDERLTVNIINSSSNSVVSSGTWLHEAVKRKDLHVIRCALDRSPSNFGDLDVYGRSPMVTALLNGAWELVSAMLECQSIDILAISRTEVVVNNSGWTVYHELRKSGDKSQDATSFEVLRELVRRDPNVNIVDFYGNTPLHTATEYIDTDGESDDADSVISEDSERRSSLLGVSEYEELLEILSSTCNIEAQNCEGSTPMHIAIANGNTSAASILLRHGADVRVTDEMFNTPTHFVDLSESNVKKMSCVFADIDLPVTRNVLGQLSPLLWLFPDGTIDINYRDFLDNSALHVHSLASFIDSYDDPFEEQTSFYDVELSLSKHFDAEHYKERNAFGQTPVLSMSLVEKSWWHEISENLKRFLSDERVKGSLTTTDERGRNILHYLLSFHPHGARIVSMYINEVNNGQLGPLRPVNDVTVDGPEQNHADLDRLIGRARTGDVVGRCSRDSLGRTPMHYAAKLKLHPRCQQCGNCGCWCTCILYLFGVDSLRVQDAFGRTPLHYNAWNENVNEPQDAVRCVLSAVGFDVDDAYNSVRDIDGHTPRQLSQLETPYDHALQPKESTFRELWHEISLFVYNLGNPTRMWSQFAGRIDAWRVWQMEVESGLRSSESRQTTEAIHVAMTSLMERLVDAVGREDFRLRGRLLSVGSASEQTKLRAPTEFDFNVDLVNFKDICRVCQPVECPPGFRVLRKRSDIDLTIENHAAYSELFNDDDTLKIPAVNFQFQAALIKVLGGKNFWDNEPLLELVNVDKVYKIRPKKLGKKLTFTLNRPINNKRILFTINVDVVPVIHFPNWWPDDATQEVDDVVRSDGCNFIFEQPYEMYRVPFRSDRHYVKISFARAESLTLLRGPQIVRTAYIVAKKICDSFADTTEYGIDDVESNVDPSDDDDDLSDRDYITAFYSTSHVLKVAALASNFAHRSPENADDDSVTETALKRQVTRVFAKFYEYAVRGHAVSCFLPSFPFKLYTYETFVGYSHALLRRISMNYETLIDGDAMRTKCELRNICSKIRGSLLLAYGLYAALSERESTVEWIYPELISDDPITT